ncbi:MAG: hypothetical protein R2774_09510 [Saprospiraceae bacterium]
MINTISLSYPWWYLILCALVGVGFSTILYFKDDRFSEVGGGSLKWVLSAIRGIAAFLIVLLLLSPFIKAVKDDIRKPIIVMAEDMSSSVVGLKDYENFKTQWDNAAAALSDKYDVRKLYFGTTTETEPKDTFQSTNIGQLIKNINDNYTDQNPSRIILASDGIVNEGADPLYQPLQFTGKLYSVALGDTSIRKDAAIQNIVHNKIAFLGDRFTANVEVATNNMENEAMTVYLEEVLENATINLQKSVVKIPNQTTFHSIGFVIEAKQPGVRRYRIRISNIDGDTNSRNNSRDFYVEILDGRQKILILANAPHPDIAALKNSISINKNYDVTTSVIDRFTGNVKDYSLVFFHNLPSAKNPVDAILKVTKDNAIPHIFIVGLQTDLTKLNAIQSAVAIKASIANTELVVPDFNPGFKAFILSEPTQTLLRILPPLSAPFGEYVASPSSEVFLKQNIKKIKTDYPLIAFEEVNNHKTGIIIGEGLWKWRLFDHLQHQNYEGFDELVNKCVQLTTVKNDKRKFRVQTSKNIYRTSENIQFDGQLYNESYDLINEPDVKLSIKDQDDKRFEYIMSKTSNAYTLSIGTFPAGAYQYEAKVMFNGKEEVSRGKFQVENLDLEAVDLTARHNMLKKLGQKYNGDIVHVSQLSNMVKSMLEDTTIKPVLYHSTSTKAAIHFKWIFFLILALLALEWFLRRYFGSY